MALIIHQQRMRCELIPWARGLEEPAREAWAMLAARLPDTPVFAYPEWYEFARVSDAVAIHAVLTVHLGDQPIAVIPLARNGLQSWEIASALAMDMAPAVIDPAHAAGAWGALLSWMRASPLVGVLALGRMETPSPLDALVAPPFCLTTEPRDPSYRIALPGDWDAYLAAIGKSTSEKIRRLQRYQRAHPELVIEVIDSPMEMDERFEDLVRLYRVQWDGQVGGSPLSSPPMVAFYRRALRWALVKDYGALIRLQYRGRTLVVASMLHIPGRRTAHFHTIARDTEESGLPNTLKSPGLMLSALAIRWAIARGAAVFSMGHGTPGYKEHLGAQPHAITGLTLARSSLAATLLPAVNRAIHLTRRIPVHLEHHLRHLLPYKAA